MQVPRCRVKREALLVLIACLLAVAIPALAQSDGDYDLSWWTVDGGGGSLSIVGGYSLSSSLGQPDAEVLASNDYVLSGGFWVGGAPAGMGHRVYLPLVLRQSP
jgi:hypothetical protein